MFSFFLTFSFEIITTALFLSLEKRKLICQYIDKFVFSSFQNVEKCKCGSCCLGFNDTQSSM